MTKSRVVDLERNGVHLGTFMFRDGMSFSVGDEVELRFENRQGDSIGVPAKVTRIYPEPEPIVRCVGV